MPSNNNHEQELVSKIQSSYRKILTEVSKVIVGQKDVTELILIALLSKGHSLLIGVPGLAKTLLVSTISKLLDLKFSRIQFTPDLMPSDITGAQIIQEDQLTKTRTFTFIKGPIFANVILADEINRTPPKTQSALLEAMQECQITSSGETYLLTLPFFVLATQNPIEQEGTYPLPEAQLDRFMFCVNIDYTDFQQEVDMVEKTTSRETAELSVVLNAEEIIELQKIIRSVPVARHMVEHAVTLAALSRPQNPNAPDYIKEWVKWGAGPRASQYLILGAKAHALLEGRYHVALEDINAMALPVMRHRLVTNFRAEAEGISSDQIIERLLELKAAGKSA